VLEARDPASGYRLYRCHHPDVVIVDLVMQGSRLGGLDVIRRMHSHDPRTRILVFSMHSDPTIAARSLEAGATGYVLKDTSSYELMKAFEQVRAGTPYLSNDLAMQVALLRTGLRANPLANLTPRELQTLSLLAQGKSYGRIAEELNVSYKTGSQRLLSAQAEAECQELAGADPSRSSAGAGGIIRLLATILHRERVGFTS
jgi:two-component system, NarL family, invasion response regulator UvrY